MATRYLLLFLFVLLTGPIQSQKNTMENKIQLVEKRFISEYLDSEFSYHILLPHEYESQSTRKFPVIYWLHGSGGWPPGALQMLASRFRNAISIEQIPPTIIVFPNDGKRHSMWVDYKDGSVKMETAIIKELIPHIDKTYRTINHSKGRILEGGSMGGYGSARLGLKYPKLFSAISLINPGPMQKVLVPEDAPLESTAKAKKVLDNVYGGDSQYFYELSPWAIAVKNASEIQDSLGIRIISGDQDPSMPNVKLFSQHLDKLKVKHEFIIVENAGHSPKSMFGALGDNYWEFFNHYFSNLEE